MRIVLDTNVIVSALLNPSGAPAGVLSLVLRGSATLLLDNRILFEYSDVLRRKKFAFPSHAIDALLDFVRASAQYVTAAQSTNRLPDEDDRPFYEVAVSGSADYLITGNKRHFSRKSFVVTPAEFLDILAERK
jgi:putative PIN family toxin of toxin-antitoxin system